MLHATLKSLLSRKIRLILSGLAVVLGVMFVSGAFVLTDTLGRSFDSLFATVYEHTDVGVSAKPKVDAEGHDNGLSYFPTSVAGQVREVPGVKSVTASAGADGARVVGSNGKVVASTGAPRIGTNWTGEDELVKLRSGRGPTADNEIAVNASLAKAAEIKIGDRVPVLTLQPKKEFTLVGIVEYSGGRDTLGGVTQVFFTEPVAQELMLGQRDTYSSLTVSAEPGISDTVLRDRISKELGAGYEVKTGQQLTDDAAAGFKQFLKFFNYILLGFAGVALFVGIFLILNTFSIIIAQRTRELALMRAVGASRIQMIVSVLVEAIAIGVIASALGLGAGVGIGALLAKVFSSMGDTDLELAGVGVPLAAVISSFAVGIVITVLAATIPALRASRVPPIAALQETATPDRPLTKISVFGGIVGVIGGVVLTLGLTGAGSNTTTLWLILAGVLICFIAVALLTPLVARPSVGVIGRPLSWSVPGKLGRINSGRNPRRTAITASALMVGLALITGVNVILDSTVKSLHKIADTSVAADLIISGDGNEGMPATFDPAALDKAKQIPGVRSAAGEYFDAGEVNGERDYLSAVTDLSAYAKMLSLKATTGSMTTLAPNQVVVDEKTAKKMKLHVGDSVKIQMSRGEAQSMTISGIYAKNDLMSGWILPQGASANFTTQQPAWGFITVADGASVDGIRKQVDTILADSPEVSVTDRTDFINQQTNELDSVLMMIQILLALAIIIAVLGVINTLALSVLERTRELGLLRAIGMRRAQAMRMVGVESIVISVFGAMLGIAVGCGLGAAVVRALHSEGITELAFPWARMGVYLGLAALVGIIAAILPAIRTARINVLNAIAYE